MVIPLPQIIDVDVGVVFGVLLKVVVIVGVGVFDGVWFGVLVGKGVKVKLGSGSSIQGCSKVPLKLINPDPPFST